MSSQWIHIIAESGVDNMTDKQRAIDKSSKVRQAHMSFLVQVYSSRGHAAAANDVNTVRKDIRSRDVKPNIYISLVRVQLALRTTERQHDAICFKCSSMIIQKTAAPNKLT